MIANEILKRIQLSDVDSLVILDETGTVTLGRCDKDYYNRKNIPEAVLEMEVKQFNIKPDALHLRVAFIPEAAYQSEERCVVDGYEKLYDDPTRGPVYAKKCEHYNAHDGSSDYTYTYAVIEGYC